MSKSTLRMWVLVAVVGLLGLAGAGQAADWGSWSDLLSPRGLVRALAPPPPAAPPANAFDDYQPGHAECWMPPRPGEVITDAQRAAMARLRAEQNRIFASQPAPQYAPGFDVPFYAVVLLVDFSDSPGTYSAQHYRDLLFTPGRPEPGSMHDFYMKVSDGLVNIQGEVVTNGTNDWYRASQTKQWYEDNDGQGLFTELIDAMDPFVDYSKFDRDGDGRIDNLIMIWAGSDTGWGTFFWPHASGINHQTQDGIRTGSYNFCQDSNGMGVFAHEYGHNLRMPDLYDYGRDGTASAGVGGYCLMAGSGWNEPTTPSAYCRQVAGWIDPINVVKPLDDVVLTPVDLGLPQPGDVYRLWRKGTGGQEYFLVENRQQHLLPSLGLMIWHVDESMPHNDWEWWPGKDPSQHYRVALEQADGRWDLEHNNNGGDATDAWPIPNVVDFDENSTPSSNDYNDEPTEVRVRNIRRDNENIIVNLATSLPGDPVRLEFVEQPTDTVATEIMAPAVTVQLLDDQDRLVDWADDPITLALGANPGNSTLSGTLTVAAVGGVATFADLSLDKVGVDYTLIASAGALPTAESDPFAIVSGPAVSLAWDQQPTDGVAGRALAPAPSVLLYDAGGNLAVTDEQTAATVALVYGTGTTGAELSGTLSTTGQGGRVSFRDLSVDLAGEGYTLAARLGSGSALESAPFAITAGAAAQLDLLEWPLKGTAGVALDLSLLKIMDAFGNVQLEATDEISAELLDADGQPAPLEGTLTANAWAGRISFENLVPQRAGDGFVLRFSGAEVGTVDSPPFAVAPAAGATLRWLQQPQAAPTRAILNPPPSVEVLDRFGNRATGESGQTVTVALGSNPSEATLTGNLGQAVVDGVVTWSDLAIDRQGTGYTLVATAANWTEATSEGFAILVRTPDPARSSVTLTPNTIGADGEEAVLRVVLRDVEGIPVQGSPPALRELGSSPAGVELVDRGAVSDDRGIFEMRIASRQVGGYDVRPIISGADYPSQALAVSQVYTLSLEAGLHLFGVPDFLPDDRPSAVFAGQEGWLLSRYDAATNRFVHYSRSRDSDPAFAFRRGRAQWVSVSRPTTLRLLGTRPAPGAYRIPLEAGWNCIANPFEADVPWTLRNLSIELDGVQTPLSRTATWSKVTPYAWWWDGTRNRFLFDRSWAGFGGNEGVWRRSAGIWLWAAEPGLELRVQPPALTAAAASREVRAPSPRDWQIALTATGASGEPATVTAGVSAELPRALRLVAPPEPVGGADVRLELISDGTTRLAGDLRPYSAGAQEFELRATARAAGPVALAWPGLSRQLPEGLVAELVDQVSGQRLLLNTRSTYSYRAATAGEQRSLLLRVRPGRPERSVVTGLTLVGGRAAGGSLAVAVSGPAELTVTVRGLGGRLVRSLSASAGEAGTVNVAWDGRDDEGRPLPAGTYTFEATARADDGALSRTQRTVTLR